MYKTVCGLSILHWDRGQHFHSRDKVIRIYSDYKANLLNFTLITFYINIKLQRDYLS
jgi:hypothetical protein